MGLYNKCFNNDVHVKKKFKAVSEVNWSNPVKQLKQVLWICDTKQSSHLLKLRKC